MLVVFVEKQTFGIKVYSFNCHQHYSLVVIMVFKQTNCVLTITSIQ